MRPRTAAIVIAAVLAAGFFLRVGLQFPLHRYANDADSLVTGFGAREILAGDLRVFCSTGVRHGAFCSYLAAGASAFVGSGRASLALAAIAISVLQMLVWWLALLELTGWPARSAGSARLLAFVALPSPAMVYFGLYWPTGYPEQMLAAMAVLWTGARFWRRGGRGELCALAFACGFAFWMSMLTLAVSLPMVLWVFWQRRRQLPAPVDLALAAISGMLGMIPWWIFNLRYGWPSLKSNWAVAPVTGWDAFVHNAARLWSEVGPALMASRLRMIRVVPATALERWADRSAWCLAAFLALVLCRALWVRRQKSPGPVGGAADLKPLLALTAGVLATNVLMFVSSGAASVPGNIARYVLPSFLVWPLLVALGWECAGRHLRLAMSVLMALLLAGYAAAVPWPWTEERRHLQSALEVERQMLELLEVRGVRTIFGSFWEAYPLIFESGGRLGGSTLEPDFDFHNLHKALPVGPCRWAMIANSQRPFNAVETSGQLGERVRFSDGRWLYFPVLDSVSPKASLDCRGTLAFLRSFQSW